MEWEAGDVKRGRVAGMAQGRGKANVGGKLAGMKADGTPDRRLRANRKTHGGRLRSHTAAGERGAGFGRSGQTVSKECGRWSRGAGVRTVMEPLYGVATRRRLKTIEAGWLAR